MQYILPLAALLASYVAAIPVNQIDSPSDSIVSPRQSCAHSATTRNCWGAYSIDTDYYDTTPSTGVVREYWLTVQNTTVSPDGFARPAFAFNGTIPGPTITADWGDNIIIHVTNTLQNNGTAIHWHGIRQKGSVEYDGVPGVTQCPISPGDTMTYKFQATQYGTSWYHSHFSLQYADGLYGPILINGPATANYDVDLGHVMLGDWNHVPVTQLWDKAKTGGPPSMTTGLISGKNTFTGSGGSKYTQTFVAGKTYRFRLVNVATSGHFQFSIDGHNLTVIANDLVPIVPFNTSSILLGEGQRYDVLVTANASPGNYWIRAGWQTSCGGNSNAAGITGIIRYDSTSTADPTSLSTVVVSTNCADQPLANLVPHLAINAGPFSTSSIILETLTVVNSPYENWQFNTSTLYLNWTEPTLLNVYNDVDIWPTDYNVVPVDTTTANGGWAVIALQNSASIAVNHPIHLHGHDFLTLAQGTGTYTAATPLNLVNPPRRDVMHLPTRGYLVIAFQLDNPGTWLLHCHIAWHASEGLAMQFVESQDSISIPAEGTQVFNDVCTEWDVYQKTMAYLQEDAGI